VTKAVNSWSSAFSVSEKNRTDNDIPEEYKGEKKKNGVKESKKSKGLWINMKIRQKNIAES